jgi:predicted nucleic acid-binding protein
METAVLVPIDEWHRLSQSAAPGIKELLLGQGPRFSGLVRRSQHGPPATGGSSVNRYLLDTNVISELRKPRPRGGVLAWLKGLRNDQIYLSAVTIGELPAGVERTPRHDPLKAAEIEAWIGQLDASVSVLPMDGRCFREYARLMCGKPNQMLEDGMIAATARVHGLTVATRNVRDFRTLGVPMTNPFEE